MHRCAVSVQASRFVQRGEEGPSCREGEVNQKNRGELKMGMKVGPMECVA